MSSANTSPNSLSIAQDLVRCVSVTPDEGGALDYLEAVLSEAGFTCHRLPFSQEGTPDVDNLYARIGTSAPHLCYAGHTDVVPVGNEKAWDFPPFEARIDQGMLNGRGTADMKGGIACFVGAVLAFLASGEELKGSISFLITGDEEGPAINGTVKMLEWLEKQGEQIDHCIVGEPTNVAEIGDMIKIGRRGSMNGWLTIKGKQGHVAYPHLASNPVPGLLAVLSAFYGERLDEGTEHFQPTNFEVTNLFIDNKATNVIPAEAKAQFNIRFNELWDGEKLQKWLHEKAKAALADTDYDYDMEFLVSGDSFLTDAGVVIKTLSAAITEVTGLTPELSTSGGTSDARFIKNYCPVIEFGLCNKTIHQVNEQVPVAHIEQLTIVFENFLKRYFAGQAA